MTQLPATQRGSNGFSSRGGSANHSSQWRVYGLGLGCIWITSSWKRRADIGGMQVSAGRASSIIRGLSNYQCCCWGSL